MIEWNNDKEAKREGKMDDWMSFNCPIAKRKEERENRERRKWTNEWLIFSSETHFLPSTFCCWYSLTTRLDKAKLNFPLCYTLWLKVKWKEQEMPKYWENAVNIKKRILRKCWNRKESREESILTTDNVWHMLAEKKSYRTVIVIERR